MSGNGGPLALHIIIVNTHWLRCILNLSTYGEKMHMIDIYQAITVDLSNYPSTVYLYSIAVSPYNLDKRTHTERVLLTLLTEEETTLEYR